ncbi:MAG: dTDP-4-dehydrorhamnose reductase [Casimicrobiaceae bacterium]
MPGRHSNIHPTILVTGANGQLGRELAAALAAHGSVVACDRAALDLSDASRIARVVRDLAPRLVVNAGAYTAVDHAEGERKAAFEVNAHAPGVLAEEARRIGAVLIHYSTDYVFDGTASVPYDEAAAPNPLNVYGESKLDGERAVAATGAHALTLRTSWVYSLHGRNFLTTIRRLAAERDELRIVSDQVGVPNWSRALAAATATLVGRGLAYLAERAGLYHLSAQGATTWYEFARAIVGDVVHPRVTPITTAEYPTPARRPAYAVLDTRRFADAFGFAMPQWREHLSTCLQSPPEPPRA